MYTFTKFLDEQISLARNYPDKVKLPKGTVPQKIKYLDQETVIKNFSKEKGYKWSTASDICDSALDNEYVQKSIYGYFDKIRVHPKGGKKLLDKPFGLVEEFLKEYKVTVTVVLSATFGIIFAFISGIVGHGIAWLLKFL